MIVICIIFISSFLDDADSGYVVIRSIRHMALPRSHLAQDYTVDGCNAHPPLLQSHSANEQNECCQSTSSNPQLLEQPAQNAMASSYLPKVYKPQRRMINYDADEVFDSDNNSTITTSAPCSNINSAKSKDSNSPYQPRVRR